MSIVRGTPDEAKRINFMQREIERAVIPYRNNTEAGLIIFALMRVARILLRLYPPQVQADLITACVAYIKGENLDDPSPIIQVVEKGVM